MTLFYGPQAMPNYWVAIGALAGVGYFLRAQADPGDRAALWGVGASAALMALMRPTDAVWVTLPLFVAAGVRPPVAATAACGRRSSRAWPPGRRQWVVEAYVSYGGLSERLAEASRIQGGLGWNIAVLDQLRALGGRSLCRPCAGSIPDTPVILWWFVLPLLAALGLAVAVRARRAARTLLPLACAMTRRHPVSVHDRIRRAALPAPPLRTAGHPGRRRTHPPGHARRAGTGDRWPRPCVTLGLAGHLAVQYAVLERAVDRTTASHRAWARTAAELHRLGVRPPCLLTGHLAIPIAFYAGCRSVQTQGHNTNTTAAEIERAAQRLPVAALTTPTGRPPAFARTWEQHHAGGLRLHVSPTAR